MAPEFRRDAWREGAAQRRELARTLVIEATSGAERINVLLLRLRRSVAFDTLSEKDRNSFNVMASQVRAIVLDWRNLEEAVRNDFVAGRIPYSAVYKIVRRA